MDTVALQSIIVKGLVSGGSYALIALSFNIVFSTAKTLNFGLGSLVMFGGLFSYLLVHQFALPFYASVLVVLVVMALVGVLTERVAVRPQRRLPHVALILSTLGFGLIIQEVANKIWGRENVASEPLTIFGERSFEVAGTYILSQEIWILGVSAGVTILVGLMVNYSGIGKHMVATSYDRMAAELVGINSNWIITFSFALSGVVAGISGILLVPMYPNIQQIGLLLGLKAFAAVILGGLGSYRGAVFGGLALGLFEALGNYFGSAYGTVFTFTLLIIALMIRPSGMFGEKTYERV